VQLLATLVKVEEMKDALAKCRFCRINTNYARHQLEAPVGLGGFVGSAIATGESRADYAPWSHSSLV